MSPAQPPSAADEARDRQLLAEADRCVKCGLCLPHCPTYRLTRDEGDSPRGRIALIQALLGGALDSPALQRHLDRCIGCRSCESACPSGVRYGLLIDSARSRGPRSGRDRLINGLVARLPYHPGSGRLLRFYQHSGLQRLARLGGGSRFRRLDDLLPELAAAEPWREVYPAQGARTGRVGLFTGCIGRIADRQALDAAIHLLTRLGLEVQVPADQACCGALQQHNGDPGAAAALAARNRAAFGGRGLDAVIYLASGCGTQLHDYPQLGGALAPPLFDVSRFLCDRPWPPGLEPAAFEGRVLLHTPCSQRHAIGQPDAALALLQRIPGIDLRTFAEPSCCGAGGAYLLSQPEMADRLRQQTLDAIAATAPDILATSNTGCAMHLAAGLRQAGSPVQVLHPVELLARQLGLQTDN